MRKERGFTLIELLIVLAILAILIGIVALSIGGLRETALKRAMQSEREVVDTGLNAFVTLATPLVTVPDQTTPVQIAPSDVFTDTLGNPLQIGEYLRRQTRFYYTWSDVGTPAQSVIVWSAASVTATNVISCDLNACYGP